MVGPNPGVPSFRVRPIASPGQPTGEICIHLSSYLSVPVLKRSTPILVLLAAVTLAWLLGWGDAFSWQGLSRSRGVIAGWVGIHPVTAPVLFVALYIAAASLCLPGASILTIAGGVLFGTVAGGAASAMGATLGAVVLFIAARQAMSGWLASRFGRWLAPLRAGLEQNAFHYVLALRLIPLFPFWLVNLAPALLGMRLAPFALATAIGIVPGSLVFASLGAGLNDAWPDETILAGGPPRLTPGLLLPLAGLGALALLPVAWKRYQRRDAARR